MEIIKNSKFEVKDIKKYELLEPVWLVLEDIPSDSDLKLSLDELFDQAAVDKEQGTQLLLELEQEFMNTLLENIGSLILSKKRLVETWLFDRHMLISTHLDIGQKQVPDHPMLQMGLNQFKILWLEQKAERIGV